MSVLLAGLLVIGFGWLVSRLGSRSALPPIAGSPNESESLQESCQSPPTRETCASVEIDGIATRYALFKTSPRTDSTVLVDVGGPGVSILSGQFNLTRLRDDLGTIGQRHNLLFVEEPWVQRTVSRPCRAALSSYYLAVRGNSNEQVALAKSLSRECRTQSEPPLWGHSPETLNKAVAAIVQSQSLRLHGMIAFSFGSVRWEWLSRAPSATDVRWAILVRPYPVGTTGTALLAARADALAQLTRGAKSRPLSGEHVLAGRTLPVTVFDQLSAQVRLPYLDEANATAAVLSGRDVATIARLSDAAWLRYGSDSVSAAYLAYLDEVCDIGGPWPPVRRDQSVRRVLVANHLPCETSQTTAPPRQPRQPTCIVTSPADGVTPAALIRKAYGTLANVEFVQVGSRSHSSSDGLTACIRRVAKP